MLTFFELAVVPSNLFGMCGALDSKLFSEMDQFTRFVKLAIEETINQEPTLDHIQEQILLLNKADLGNTQECLRRAVEAAEDENFEKPGKAKDKTTHTKNSSRPKMGLDLVIILYY